MNCCELQSWVNNNNACELLEMRADGAVVVKHVYLQEIPVYLPYSAKYRWVLETRVLGGFFNELIKRECEVGEWGESYHAAHDGALEVWRRINAEAPAV